MIKWFGHKYNKVVCYIVPVYPITVMKLLWPVNLRMSYHINGQGSSLLRHKSYNCIKD